MGEYAAMYLINWNPELLKMGFDQNKIGAIMERFLPEKMRRDSEKKLKKNEIEQFQREYNKQLNLIKEFKITLPKVRRLLANIPTYMIFDDHDITDDWNITESWKAKVMSSSLGKHVIANGLTTYWAFQGWGNDPNRFNDSFIQKITNYTTDYQIKSSNYQEWMNSLFDFKQWFYIAPTNPKTVILDTRTQRSYPKTKAHLLNYGFIDNQFQAPNLLSDEGWNLVSSHLLANGWSEGSPLIIVSAAPLLGIGLIDTFLSEVIQPLSQFNSSIGTTFDLEWWKFNERGYEGLQEKLGLWNPSTCIILSGDAHMAFSYQAKIVDETIPLYQFTSSPIKNVTFDGLRGAIMKSALILNEYIGNHSFRIQNKQIEYNVFENGSLIETVNNIGFLKFTENEWNHTYLNSNGIPINRKDRI
ncbi:metallophosphoesterase family protein [Litchfieldia alkalitelluris]|uniref:hypothetical protein n=1 Tax=Litchfieldia alkalitelluris TaxID=304268 RepID=UPI001956CB3D|nr:hypothetical protein [Litchfieldia alkalitelluris]